jgi:hypothetical protein
MMILASILDSKASFTITALVVTWVGFALLTLMVLGLHAQLRRLARSAPAPPATTSYGRLSERRLSDVLESNGVGPPPRVLLFVSTGCRSCARVLADVAAPSWTAPTTVLFTDGVAEPPVQLPPHVGVVDDGGAVSSSLGIGVTPFVIVVGKDGRVLKASPVNSLETIAPLIDSPPNPARPATGEEERKGANHALFP